MIRTTLFVGLSAFALCGHGQSQQIDEPSRNAGYKAHAQQAPSPNALLVLAPGVGGQSMNSLFPSLPRTSVPHVTPAVDFDPIVESQVQDIHLRPLYTTAIKLPQAVSSLAVGAPTEFEAEHKDQEPNLVFVKPSTHAAAESNLLIALVNGDTISVRLISPGDAGSSDPVDFVVDFSKHRSLFGSNANGVTSSNPVSRSLPQSSNTLLTGAVRSTPVPALDASSALTNQGGVAAPTYLTAKDLTKLIKANALAPNSIAIAIGEIRQEEDSMVVSFSVLNVSPKWVTIMPPQIELTNPLQSKKDKKKNGTFAVPVAVSNYLLANPKLPPGARADGSVTFPKPESKLAREGLLLHIAISGAIDTPIYYPLPFVAPSTAEAIAEREIPNAVH